MILLIAYGNSLRRDDGAGHVIAEAIERILCGRNIAVERIGVHQLMPELCESIARDSVSAVLFIDTRVTIKEAWPEVRLLRLPSGVPATPLGHHLNPAVLMHFARVLFGRTPPAWLLTIPGFDFGHGEGLSDRTGESITRFLAKPDFSWLL